MIKFLGHASFYLKFENTSVVVDPWFSKTGAFLGSWAQFPDNSKIDFSWKEDLDYVCITHEHEDHFDLEWLSTLNNKVKIIIPKYEDRYLFTILSQNVDNDIIEVPTKTRYKINDSITICPVIQSVPIWDDCSYIFETPMGTFLDMNDMKPANEDLEWIKENFDIDIFAMQYSGANWHPMVYDYPEEEKVEISKKKIKIKYDAVIRLFKEFDAKYLVPNFGPPCFLSDDQFDLNFSDHSIFPTQDHFYEYLKEVNLQDKTAILLPGDEFTEESFGDVTTQNLQHECFTNKKEYLKRYKEERNKILNGYLENIETPPYKVIDKVKEYFQPFIRKNKFYRDQINGSMLLEIKGAYNEDILVDFSKPINSVKPYEGEKYFCKFEIESKFLNLILDYKITWEELLLSLRFKAHRWPDEYNESLVVFLRFMRNYSEAAIKQYEVYETSKLLNETFSLNYEGEELEVQRYCPHALGDLSKGEVVDGHVICPLHGWEFNLKTGVCKGKSKYCIKVDK